MFHTGFRKSNGCFNSGKRKLHRGSPCKAAGVGLEQMPSSSLPPVGHPPFERVQVLVGDQRWGFSELLIVDDDPQRTSKALILGPHLRDSGYDDVLQRLIEGHGGRHNTTASFGLVLGLPLLLLGGATLTASLS
jgi:hypothetical protein